MIIITFFINNLIETSKWRKVNDGCRNAKAVAEKEMMYYSGTLIIGEVIVCATGEEAFDWSKIAMVGSEIALAGRKIALAGSKIASAGRKIARSGSKIASAGSKIARSGRKIACSGRKTENGGRMMETNEEL